MIRPVLFSWNWIVADASRACELDGRRNPVAQNLRTSPWVHLPAEKEVRPPLAAVGEITASRHAGSGAEGRPDRTPGSRWCGLSVVQVSRHRTETAGQLSCPTRNQPGGGKMTKMLEPQGHLAGTGSRTTGGSIRPAPVVRLGRELGQLTGQPDN